MSKLLILLSLNLFFFWFILISFIFLQFPISILVEFIVYHSPLHVTKVFFRNSYIYFYIHSFFPFNFTIIFILTSFISIFIFLLISLLSHYSDIIILSDYFSWHPINYFFNSYISLCVVLAYWCGCRFRWWGSARDQRSSPSYWMPRD